MHSNLIGGLWTTGETPSAIAVVNPATLKPLGDVPDLRPEDVMAAVAQAKMLLPTLQASAAWRAEQLARAAVRVRAAAADLARTLSLESGQPLWEALDTVTAVADLLGAPLPVPAADDEPPGIVLSVLEPNFALCVWARELHAAVAAGRAGVWALPLCTPLTLLECLRLADLPPGWVTTVTGHAAGPLLAAGLPARAGIRRAIVVTADADPELAAHLIAAVRLYHGGQLAHASLRVYAEEGIARSLGDALHLAVALLECGDPVRPGTDLGPLQTAAAADTVERQVGLLLKQGGTLKVGARRFKPWGLPGHFFQPTVLTGVPIPAVLAAGAIRGPVVAVSTVTDSAAALAAERDGDPGLELTLIARNPAATAAALALPLAAPAPTVDDGASLADDILVRSGLCPPGTVQAAITLRPLTRLSSLGFPYAERPRPVNGR